MLIDTARLNAKGYHTALCSDTAACTACGCCALMCPDSAISVYKEA
jgi:2-oxoglutarate ferredoxin oxidoreductase subunit delta